MCIKTAIGTIAIAFAVNLCFSQSITEGDGPLQNDTTRVEVPEVVSDSADTTTRPTEPPRVASDSTDTTSRRDQKKEIQPQKSGIANGNGDETKKPAPTAEKRDLLVESVRLLGEHRRPSKSSEQNLSPFAFNQTHAVGITLEYFSYAEHSLLSDIFGDTLPPIPIYGAPKSTEYGLVFGLNYDGSMRSPGSPVLFRPNLEVHFGIHQTYNGSTQALLDTTRRGQPLDFKFDPVLIYKNNYFVQAGLDVGYCRTRTAVPFYLYSGISGRLWYRDQVADTTSYSNQLTVAEVYYWFTAPVGIAVSMPVTPRLAIGLDAACDFMFFGQMEALNSAWDAESTYVTKSPAVTLADRIGYHVEISFIHKTARGVILRFAPFFKYYAFGKSEPETSKQYVNGAYTGSANDLVFTEPSSESWIVGAKFQFVFMSGSSRAP